MSEKMPRQLQTTNLIDHACIHLLKTTNFNQLTIKMILNQAGIARGTFYHYYSDKYALLDHIEDQLINQIAFIFTAHQHDGDNTAPFHEVLNYLYQQRQIVLTLLQCAASQLNHKIHRLIMTKIGRQSTLQTAVTPLAGDVTTHLAQELLITNILTILKFWLSQPTVATPAVAYTIFIQSRTLTPADLAKLAQVNW
ncbi:TetR/AcrR family transcriptional regulator [Lactiplantibacillus paraplantarum]|uniref:TetR/AcrR family transcriptional regulator n=1 Tax=Lactiplantibacillus paraplantarum TaxID=60520 RepID=UPI0005140E90|nr:TetR/AcrR family transcriptional regulator [Lactiplantibacillus paraplantarum]ALO04086.1 hypothetical protein ASU28_06840 [Lactiplantibacillus paraplantarum]KGE74478.1 hypothetical protein HR47_12005 [Lactiplantibacillus paraplantarum]MCW1910186.1 TetR/AcrR family transcriptional regulator [Lactiplantibacillus paraplantarum]OAX74525.1 hypothetical protein A0U96_01015 [Lactiplantibacillus plantarum]